MFEMIAIKYPELTAPARLTIWRKFFELAGCPLWGSDPDGFVKLDGKEPRCYVSLSDLEALAQKPFNGQHTLYHAQQLLIIVSRTNHQKSSSDCPGIGTLGVSNPVYFCFLCYSW
jgi:hypothetical protein